MATASRRVPGQLALGVCAVCGQTYLPVGRGTRADYCSPACRRASVAERRDLRRRQTVPVAGEDAHRTALADALYALGCAAEDARSDLAEAESPEDHRAIVEWLLENIDPLAAHERRLRAERQGS